MIFSREQFDELMKSLSDMNLIVMLGENMLRMRKNGNSENREERLVFAIRQLILKRRSYWIEMKSEVENLRNFYSKVLKFVSLSHDTFFVRNAIGDMLVVLDIHDGLVLDDVYALIALEMFNPWLEEKEEGR